MIFNLEEDDWFNFMSSHYAIETTAEYLAPVTKLPAENQYECGFVKAIATFTSILNSRIKLNSILKDQISLFLRAITSPEGLRGIEKTNAKVCCTVQVFALGLDNICKNRHSFGFAKYIVKDNEARIDEDRGPKYSLNSYIFYVTATETGLVGHQTSYLSLYRTAKWGDNTDEKTALYNAAKHVMSDLIATLVVLSGQTTTGPVPVLQLLVRCRTVLVGMNAYSRGFNSCVKQSLVLLAYILHQFGLDYQLFSGRLTKKVFKFGDADLSDIAIPSWLIGTVPVNSIKAVLHFDRDDMNIEFGNNLRDAFNMHFPAV